MLDVLTPFTRSSYRKAIGNYSFKIGGKHAHKKPGLIPLHVKNNITASIKDQYRAKLLIARLERESTNLFGEFVHKGFKLDRNKVPKILIPELENFDLKPYVSCHTPKVTVGEEKE